MKVALRIGAMLCLAISVVLMSFPGVAMRFSDGPDKSIMRYYSYFSIVPPGYANWCCLLTAILALVVLVLLAVGFRANVRRLPVALLAAMLVLSLVSFLLFDSFTPLAGGVFGLHAAALLFSVLLTARDGSRRGSGRKEKAGGDASAGK